MKTFFTSLAFILSFISLTSTAQIVKEHTYPSTNVVPFRLSNGSLFYAINDYGSNLLTLYNADHSIYKIITLPELSGYSISSAFNFSDKLFNLTPEIEFTVDYVILGSSGVPNVYKFKILTETGTELATIDGLSYDAKFINTTDGAKLISHVYTSSGNRTDVYSLPGQLPLSASLEVEEMQKLNPYPNPTTSSTINLPYEVAPGQQGELIIYDTRGTIMKTFTIDSTFNSLLLDVRQYAKGMYVYTVRQEGKPNKNARFLVQ